ncbi:DoxX family protein [Nevskia ramosa]|uniref:DoxX family protein n=1 Tax=Nevskia ramosa TaxID=64002 RepID=UPI00235331EE|nr:hypothetical protein [Nevskia ramosa]
MINLPASPARRAGLIFTFLWFLIGGIGHFAAAGFFASIVPPWVPEPLLVVYLSGVVELALAAQLIPLRTRPLAGAALILLIVAVTPANVWMLQQQATLFPQFSVWLLSLRLVIQVALIANVWWSTRPEPQRTSPSR